MVQVMEGRLRRTVTHRCAWAPPLRREPVASERTPVVVDKDQVVGAGAAFRWTAIASTTTRGTGTTLRLTLSIPVGSQPTT